MIQITMIKQKFTLKQGTKTAYQLESEKKKEITDKEFTNITSNDTLKFFRRLGGSETVIKNYTCRGYEIVRLTSTSPDKKNKTVRNFSFELL